VWDALAPRIANARTLTVLTDFDGVLAPIRRRPDRVRLGTRMRSTLLAFRRTGTLLGIVSGRNLADVRARVGIPGIWYVGCHGYEFENPAGRVSVLVTPAEAARLARACRIVPRLRHLAGIRVEIKDTSVAIHYRDAGRRAIAHARAVLDDALAADERLRMIDGKAVWEILPGHRVSKWTAVQSILARERRTRGLLVYIGDDVTDEDVFSRMRGISIVVGKTTATAAHVSVRTPSEVRHLLRQIAEVRP
jgi:trehalose-phosphatase